MNKPAGHHDAEASAAHFDVAAALEQHGRWLRTVLAARGVDRVSLDDAMQNVCTAAVAGASRLKDRQRVGPWLYRISVVEALQYRRKAGRRRRLHDHYAGSGAVPSEWSDNDPLAWLLAEEAQHLVRQAVWRLPPRDAEILLLKYTEDWSYRQLADHLGVSTSAVEARLHRARGKLRNELAALAPETAICSPDC
jgi:RNA polymerase sigma-70 factor (ECF subfamily)